MQTDLRRVLSIQSQVVHGYVGNNCATFPLQLLGYDVCPINSVQFSNHKGMASAVREDEPFSQIDKNLTAYASCTGQVSTANDIDELYKGLKANDVNTFSHVLTGFCADVTFLETVCDIIADLKRKNPQLIYVCDPVIGDNGHMYVSKDLIPVYKNRVLPLADVIVPNHYEAEWLTDTKITSEAEAIEVMNKLHEKGVGTVIISSTHLGQPDKLLALASKYEGSERVLYRMKIPKLLCAVVGTGDVFAALLLAWSDKDKNIKVAMEKTICTMQKIIRRTMNDALECCGGRGKPSVAQLELRLVQSKQDIEHPELFLEAEQIHL